MSLPALYEISSLYREALQRLGDLELDDNAVRDTLEGLKGTLELKATNVAAYCRNLEAVAESIKEAEAKMRARRQAIAHRAQRLREYLRGNMEACGIAKIEAPEFVIAVRQNPPHVEVFDPAQVPNDYRVYQEPSIDIAGIGRALKRGEDVPGARLVEGTTRVDIR